MTNIFRILAAFASGTLFAFGLGIGGMLNPPNVFGFLDIAGDWKPGLAFVMLGAIPVYFLANQLGKKMSKPLFSSDWSHLPKIGWNFPNRAKWGSVLFGAGWGLSGLCPGPALVSALSLKPGILVFTVAMILGFLLFDKIRFIHGH